MTHNMNKLINLLPIHLRKVKITQIIRYINFLDKAVRSKNSNSKLNSNFKFFLRTTYYLKHQAQHTSQVYKKPKIPKKSMVILMQIQLHVCLDIEFNLINRIKKSNNQNLMHYKSINQYTSLQKKLLKN